MSSRPSAERRARLLPLSPALLLVLLPEIGCFVSFDGYGPLETNPDASAGGTSSSGGESSSGGVTPTGGAGGGGGIQSTGGRAGGGASGGLTGSGGLGTGGTGGTVASGGAVSTGGVVSTGGTSAGGASTGGASGGSPATGGTGTGGAGTGGAGTGGSPIRCPGNLAGPALVEVPRPGGGWFCIDSTEVTNENYAAFLASAPVTTGQVAACTWNTNFAPQTSSACSGIKDAATYPKLPVACIDWCDAKRYCEWAGKRLCGAQGGGPTVPSRFADATHSQWYTACSTGGTRLFPYGDIYDGDACVGLNHDGAETEDVGTNGACRGGYLGIYDMSGNVAEWEDSCGASSGASDACLVRGGSRFSDDAVYDTPPVPTLLCNSSNIDDTTPSPGTARRDGRSAFIGVRCCYDI